MLTFLSNKESVREDLREMLPCLDDSSVNTLMADSFRELKELCKNLVEGNNANKITSKWAGSEIWLVNYVRILATSIGNVRGRDTVERRLGPTILDIERYFLGTFNHTQTPSWLRAENLFKRQLAPLIRETENIRLNNRYIRSRPLTAPSSGRQYTYPVIDYLVDYVAGGELQGPLLKLEEIKGAIEHGPLTWLFSTFNTFLGGSRLRSQLNRMYDFINFDNYHEIDSLIEEQVFEPQTLSPSTLSYYLSELRPSTVYRTGINAEHRDRLSQVISN